MREAGKELVNMDIFQHLGDVRLGSAWHVPAVVSGRGEMGCLGMNPASSTAEVHDFGNFRVNGKQAPKGKGKGGKGKAGAEHLFPETPEEKAEREAKELAAKEAREKAKKEREKLCYNV